MLNRVFGSPVEPLVRDGYVEMSSQLTSIVEKDFVNDQAATRNLRRLPLADRASKLVTFEESPQKQKPWERVAQAKVVSKGSNGVVEASLHELVRNYGSDMSTSAYYGQDFLDRNPDIVEDFWRFDNDGFPFLAIGIPTWAPIGIFQAALASRARLAAALKLVYRMVDQYDEGVPVDFDADMSDISPVLLGRHRIFKNGGFTADEAGAMEVGFFWGQHANSHVLFYWLVLYIYATPGLIDSLREELAPVVTIENEKGLDGISIPRITNIDLAAVVSECPLLKSCTLEALRLGNDPASIRRLNQPISFQDADKTTSLPAGTWISVPHAVTQFDASNFPSPQEFIPDRFIHKDDTGKPVVRAGKMRPWGAGAGMCKGRTFAERQMMVTAASLLMLWDMEPVAKTADGKWELPGTRPGTGAVRPDRDLKVKIKRRVI